MASSSPTAISSDVGLLGKLKALYRRRETVQFLVASNLKAGHRDKLLGHLWSLLDPLLFAGGYFVVFGFIFRMTSRGRGADFMIYLVVGVFAWKFMEGAVTPAEVNAVQRVNGPMTTLTVYKKIDQPEFDVIISCGRKSVIPSIHLKNNSKKK